MRPPCTPSYQEIRRALRERQHIAVPFPMSPAQLDAAMHAWFRFLTLPPDFLLSLFRKDVLADGRSIESGFRDPKREEGELHDNKFVFHYSERTQRLFAERAAEFKESADFFDLAGDVLKAAKQTFWGILEQFEAAHPGSVAKVFPQGDAETFIAIRCLAYRGIQDGDVLAADHVDRGPGTLHITETNPRLLLGPTWETMQPIDVQPGWATFFGGTHIDWFFPGEGFVSAKHRVVQEGPPCKALFGRGSMVAFMDTLGPMPKIREGIDTKKPT